MYMRRCLRLHGIRAIALIEAVTTAGLISLVAVGSVQAMTLLNQRAAVNRLFLNARSIVQRNIDTALEVACTSSSIPSILATTGTAGALYDEGTGATTVAVALQGSGSVTLVNGTLTRTVLPVANTLNASILQVTFRVDYTYGSKPYSYQITTMRAYDD
jgi:hypothetical protein